MTNSMALDGKRILVTGASSGIGRETALLLSELGAEVVCIARNRERLEQTLAMMDGCDHSVYSFDLTQVDEIGALVEKIVCEHGKLDGLAYCAGVGSTYPFRMTDYQKTVGVFNVNVFGFLEMARMLSMKRNRNEQASFIGVSSIASVKGEKGLVAYCASKGAMDSAVRAMARELGSSGVRINTIQPGWIQTELVDYNITAFGSEQYEDKIDEMQVLGIGSPQDVANAIAFLLSDASKLITGTHLVVDGGYLA